VSETIENEPTQGHLNLGMELLDGGGRLNIWSESATEIKLLLLNSENISIVDHEIQLERGEGGVWSRTDERLTAGVNYVLRANGPAGPRHGFNPERNLLDPYAKALVRNGPQNYHCVAVKDEFDWQGVSKPGTALSESIIYEAHLRGLTRLNPAIPEEIRGSYAALAHPATIDYLTKLGITAIELLPIHAFIS